MNLTTTPPPSTDGVTAAQRYGWGVPDAGDEFTLPGRPDPRLWAVYDSPGHNGQGRRTPDAITQAGGILTITGDAAGNTGGMAWRDGQLRGRWEVRMRAPVGADQLHPVVLLWPDAEDWPVGGEVDFAEVFRGDRQEVEFFLHYGANNSQTSAKRALDVTAWNNYAVEWTSSCVVGYVNAQEWFRDCTPGRIPPRAMHLTLQLDWFPDGKSTLPSRMDVDFVRIYNL